MSVMACDGGVSPTIEVVANRELGGVILSDDALSFLKGLANEFTPRIREILALREERQERFDGGEAPDFLEATREIREGDWICAPTPPQLKDRRVEITGPVDRKMVINALNSGANVFMADFEDSNSPTWANVMEGQVNLFDAVRRTITYTHPTTEKHYSLVDQPATLFVRPRGWHLSERGIAIGGQPIAASLVDFGLFFFHNAKELMAHGEVPCFYLPKLEHHLEARLWNDVFCFAQDALGIARGTIKATVLIETLPAAFQMHEILFELRQHSAGLNCGRWDYIFSFIKTFRAHRDRVMPDRGLLGMTQPFMRAYSRLAIQTCHRRGVHAMGGMAAQIPIKNDAAANTAALDKVRADKRREVTDGHDGTWVAHPALVPLAREIFDQWMPDANQIGRSLDDLEVGQAELLAQPEGEITEAGLRQNVNVALLYLEAWLRGKGCVPLYHLMEDAATAEISRTQLWQWIRHEATLRDGGVVTHDLFEAVLGQELARVERMVGSDTYESGRFDDAAMLLRGLASSQECATFLTLGAYDLLDVQAS